MLELRAEDAKRELFQAGGGRRVRLWDGERISGQILELDKDILRLRTAWAARLELPRAAVAAIEPLPGWRTILDEDFRRRSGEPSASTTGLRFVGEPTFTDMEEGAAARALVLRGAGQSLTCTLTKPLTAGRVGVNFQERGQARGARWTVELLFQQGERVRHVSIVVAGDGEHYAVDASPNLEKHQARGQARQVKRTPGWHRLIVQFSKDSLVLTCDDDVIWHDLDDGPGGQLRRVTIACQRLAESEGLRGSVDWTEFCIERAVDEHPHPPVDGEQDAVRLFNDDRLFGHILHADRHTLRIEGRFGKRSLPWTVISRCSFCRPAAAPKTTEAAKVRLLLRSGLCAEPDVLEGIVAKQDERRLVLRHALLGELKLERSRVRQLQPLPRATN